MAKLSGLLQTVRIYGYHDDAEEEIIALATEQNEENDNKSEDDGVSYAVSHSQACDALETVLVYLIQQPHVPESITLTINSLLIETNKKRYNTYNKLNLLNIISKQ